ncbi:hypothetical protein POTOM_037597 [Populus tomentosa]|uniref:Uncharacterized protein n=1 Tax=Populus tomentosa TaxID=118781 RepID=A0A8X7YW16_POPTO|nr:hypothetical protein POTOM_037597 [Populus tomentosa]
MLFSVIQLTLVKLSYIKESEEMRLATQPWKLIKRVKEIEQEVHAGPETVQQKDIKQTAAADLSKRLQDFRSLNNASSLKGEVSSAVCTSVMAKLVASPMVPVTIE